MKNLLNINGAKVLSKAEQGEIKGGKSDTFVCDLDGICPFDLTCVFGICMDFTVSPLDPR